MHARGGGQLLGLAQSMRAQAAAIAAAESFRTPIGTATAEAKAARAEAGATWLEQHKPQLQQQQQELQRKGAAAPRTQRVPVQRVLPEVRALLQRLCYLALSAREGWETSSASV